MRPLLADFYDQVFQEGLKAAKEAVLLAKFDVDAEGQKVIDLCVSLIDKLPKPMRSV